MPSRKRKPKRKPNDDIVTMPRRVLGMDLSLNATGISVTDALTKKRLFGTCLRSNGVRASARIKNVSDEIVAIAREWQCDEAVAEAFFIPQRKRAAKAVETLWLHGVVVVDLALAGLPPPLYVPGSTLRKWIADDGRAEKEDMQRAVHERFSILIEDDNECDAYALTICAIAYNRWRVGDTASFSPYEKESVVKWERAFGISDDEG